MKLKHSFTFLCILCCILLGNLSWAVSDKPPIRIGATVSMEGQYKEPSRMIQKSFLLWEREVNQKGGLLGRKVEMILYDDKSQKQLVRELYQKLIEEDKVDLVFSPYGTPLTIVASEVSEQNKLIMIACAAAGEIIWERGFQYTFGIYAPANRFFIGMLDMMARRGHKTVSLVYNDASPFNIEVAEGVKKWAKKFKIAVAHEMRYQNGKKELSAIVSNMKEVEAKRLIVSAYPPDCYHLLSLMQKIKYKPLVLGMTVAPIHPNFWKKAGGMADRIFGPSQWEPNERIPFPGTQKFVIEFKGFTGKTPSYHAGSAYASCQLYEEAIRKTQSLDNEEIRNYIAALDTVTVIGRFKVDASGKQIGHNSIIVQWQNGKKEIVWPSKMQTAPPLL